jgi:calcineurin-like phosphoesterase family protein
MNRVLKLKQTDNQKVYWVSDTHLNHNRDFVYEVRGHKSSEEHTSFVINKINEIVRPGDILIHLGDFCLNTEENGLNSLLARIQCQTIFMLWGNHNNPLWKVYRRELDKALKANSEAFSAPLDGWTPAEEIEVYPFRYKNVVLLGNYAEISVDGHYFCVSHYPVHVFNHMSDGAKMVCGHSHYGLPFSQADNLQSKILDVGWDGFSKPLSTSEVLAIMNKKSIFVSGDHHKK